MTFFDSRERADSAAIAAWNTRAQSAPAPIDMILHCPKCHAQHIDEPDGKDWTNPPHRSHLCHACGTIWRPADVATNGVRDVKTCGQADTWGWDGSSLAAPAPDILGLADKAVEWALDSFGAYCCEPVDAGIAYMQARGKDRWSMQAQMEADMSWMPADVAAPVTDDVREAMKDAALHGIGIVGGQGDRIDPADFYISAPTDDGWNATFAALTALAEHGVPPDIQEMLIRGNAKEGIAPGALGKAADAAIAAYRSAQ